VTHDAMAEEPNGSVWDVRVPSLGQSAETATLLSWAVEPGARVRRGDVIAVVETDKTEIPVEAPADGVLGAHLAGAGDELAIGTVLCVVQADREADGEANPEGIAHARSLSVGAEPVVRAPISPRARRLAEQRGIDPLALVGSGPDGLIVERDVPDVSASAGAGPGGAGPGGAGDGAGEGRRSSSTISEAAGEAAGQRAVGERVALTPTRQTAVRRLTRSWSTAPHFVQMVDVDGTRLARRPGRGPESATDALGTIPSVTDAVVAATARTLVAHPEANARYDDGDLVRYADVPVGIAVDTPRGLLVVTVRDADRLSLHEIAASRAAMVARARTGRLEPGDTGPASATVSNLGAWGIRAGTPVLNDGEPMLVFVGELAERVVALDGRAIVRPMLTLSIAYDHRVLDGAAAARVTTDIRQRLESDPWGAYGPDEPDPGRAP
jgi:pyruvate/2-oxoglutarate dehydrogenase complex dihydrolipoamide acyltransferase (E2) component